MKLYLKAIRTQRSVHTCARMHTHTHTHTLTHVQRMEENRIPKIVLYMNFETTCLSSRPRSSWQDEMRNGGRMVGGEGWQEKV